MHVYIREGTYNLDETLVFGAQDSGTADFNVVYEAYPGESPVISGGYEIDETWTNTGGHMWTVTVPEVAAGAWVRHLWRDGERCQRSRWPNPGSQLNITNVSPDLLTITLSDTIPGTDASFADSNSESVMYHRWSTSRARIVSKTGSSINTYTVCGQAVPGGLFSPDYPYAEYGWYEHRIHLEHHPDFIDVHFF